MMKLAGMDNLTSLVQLDRNSPLPLHEQLRTGFRDHMLKNRLAPGTPFPSERRVSETLSVNRHTVHRAYEALKADGLLENHHGRRGAFVARRARERLAPAFPTIGIVLPRTFSEYLESTSRASLKYLKGIIDAAAELRQSTIILTLPPSNESPEKVRAWLDGFIDRTIGVIHLGSRGGNEDVPLKTLLDTRRVPQIFVSGQSTLKHVSSVVGDVVPGGMAAANLLLEHGHRRVGVFSADSDSLREGLFHYHAATRSEEMLQCLKNAGLTAREQWIAEGCERLQNLEAELDRILELDGGPTAFWCQNDDMAFNVIAFLRERNLAVPKDVSVIGYDDIESGQTDEAILTTIKHPARVIAKRAVELAADLYENREPGVGETVMVPTSLVVRRSVANAKKDV